MEVTITQSRKEPFTAGPARSTLTYFHAKANIIPTGPSAVREEYSFKPPLLQPLWAPNARLQASFSAWKSVELHCHHLIGVLAQYPAFSSFRRQVVDVFSCCRRPFFLPSVLPPFPSPCCSHLPLVPSATRAHIEGIVSYTLQGVESTKSWVRKIKLLPCSNQRQAILHHWNSACATVHFNWIPGHRNICSSRS